MQRKNSTSPLRKGFSYEEIWGFFFCVEWLKDNEKFDWIKFQSVPEEADNKFYLDDIIISKDNKYHLYQIKHKQDKRDLWTWDSFLIPSAKRGTSIMEKWGKSYLEIADNLLSASFITNGVPDKKISDYLVKEMIDLEKIKTSNTSLYTRILKCFNDKSAAECFFKDFKFKFNQEEILEIEKVTEELLIESLNSTRQGCLSLKETISKEFRESQPREIRLEEIKKWCEFCEPKPLNEEFTIPEDYQLFNDDENKKILAKIESISSVTVICGKPGSGKSTYLSSLYENLKLNNKIVIRHHFYISPDDPDFAPRLMYERSGEALKAQLKEYRTNFSQIVDSNLSNTDIGDLISSISAFLAKSQKSLVLILDGLDHIDRYGSNEELKKFLEKVCVPQDGLHLILGTQESVKQLIPQCITRVCTEKNWTIIDGLSYRGLSKIVDKNLIMIKLPSEDQQLEEIKKKLLSVTSGNPLHLRYTLSELKQLCDRRQIMESDLDNLSPYGEDIFDYYSAIWKKIPDSGKIIASTIAFSDFSYKEDWLMDCTNKLVSDALSQATGYKSICHLLKNDDEEIVIYHHTFKSFIKEQPEYTLQISAIRKSIIDWIENSGDQGLQWSELKKLKYLDGDPGPISSLDREWLVQAIFDCRDTRKILSQLHISAKALSEQKKYDNLLLVTKLIDYFNLAYDYNSEIYEKFRVERIINGDINLPPEKRLTNSELYAACTVFATQGKKKKVNLTLKELMDRQELCDPRTFSNLAVNILKTISLSDDLQLDKALKFIRGFASKDETILFDEFFKKVIEAGKSSAIIKYIPKFKKAELVKIFDLLAESDLKNNSTNFLELIGKQTNLSVFSITYLLLNEKQHTLPSLPNYDLFPDKVLEYETEKRSQRAKIYSELYLLGLCYALSKHADDLMKWIENCPEGWQYNVGKAVLKYTIKLATNIEKKTYIGFDFLIKYLSSIPPLLFLENRDLYELQVSFNMALIDIFFFTQIINKKYETFKLLRQGDLKNILATKYFEKSSLFKLLIKLKFNTLEKSCIENLLKSESKVIIEKIVPFTEKAEELIILAKIARIYNQDIIRTNLLRLAANNLVTYGYHKDMFLDAVIDSMTLCYKAGIKRNEWIKDILPLVDNISEYTDSDETHHFKVSITEALSAYSTELAYSYFLYKFNKEEYYDAQRIFASIIENLDYSKLTSIALASTAIDEDSYQKLNTIAEQKPEAKKALDLINDYLGEIDYSERQHQNSNHTIKEDEGYKSVSIDDFDKHIESLENIWEVNRFTRDWLKYNLSIFPDKKEKIYEKAMNGSRLARFETLDVIYPIASDLGKSEAFDLLCKAHIDNYGWNPYWNDQGISRLDFLKSNFPERKNDFFNFTTTDEKTGSSFFPFPRGINFFLLFNDKKTAELVTQQGVDFAKSLMADVEFEKNTWLETKKDEIDIIIERLTWPSHLVRERSANAIALLLKDESYGQDVYNKLKLWLSNQKLETVIVLGILPLIKASETQPVPNFIKVSDLQNHIKTTSLNIENCLEILKDFTEEDVIIQKKRKTINVQLADNWLISPFFKKYVSSVIPQKYKINALEIEERAGIQFMKVWSYVAHNLLRETGTDESIGELDTFGGYRGPKGILPGASSRISEIYRSAYIRTLQHFERDISPDFYLDYNYETFPIDISYWRVKPQKKPDWWQVIPTEKCTSLEVIEYEKSVQEIIKYKEDGKIILAFDGYLDYKCDKNEESSTQIELIGFGYALTGKTVPEPEKLANLIFGNYNVVLPSEAENPLMFLNDTGKLLSTKDSFIKKDSLIIWPLVGNNHPLATSHWQWFRFFNKALWPSATVGENLEANIKDNSVEIIKNDKIVGIWTDWLFGLKERHIDGLGIPHGNHLLIDENYLNNLLGKNFRLAYLLRITHKIDKGYGEKPDEISYCKYINLSNIIV